MSAEERECIFCLRNHPPRFSADVGLSVCEAHLDSLCDAVEDQAGDDVSIPGMLVACEAVLAAVLEVQRKQRSV